MGPLWAPASHQTCCPSCFPQYSAGSKALENGLAPVLWGFLWHLALNHPYPLTLPISHLWNNGRCKKTDQRPRLEPGFKAQNLVRIMDQSEIKVRSHSMANSRSQSVTEVKTQSATRIWTQSVYVIKAQGSERNQNRGSAWD